MVTASNYPVSFEPVQLWFCREILFGVDCEQSGVAPIARHRGRWFNEIGDADSRSDHCQCLGKCRSRRDRVEWQVSLKISKGSDFPCSESVEHSSRPVPIWESLPRVLLVRNQTYNVLEDHHMYCKEQTSAASVHPSLVKRGQTATTKHHGFRISDYVTTSCPASSSSKSSARLWKILLYQVWGPDPNQWFTESVSKSQSDM